MKPSYSTTQDLLNYIRDGFRRGDPRIERILRERRDASKTRRAEKPAILTANPPTRV